MEKDMPVMGFYENVRYIESPAQDTSYDDDRTERFSAAARKKSISNAKRKN